MICDHFMKKWTLSLILDDPHGNLLLTLVSNCPAQHGFRAAFYWFLQGVWNYKPKLQNLLTSLVSWWFGEALTLWLMCFFCAIQLLWRTLYSNLRLEVFMRSSPERTPATEPESPTGIYSKNFQREKRQDLEVSMSEQMIKASEGLLSYWFSIFFSEASQAYCFRQNKLNNEGRRKFLRKGWRTKSC